MMVEGAAVVVVERREEREETEGRMEGGVKEGIEVGGEGGVELSMGSLWSRNDTSADDLFLLPCTTSGCSRDGAGASCGGVTTRDGGRAVAPRGAGAGGW